MTEAMNEEKQVPRSDQIYYTNPIIHADYSDPDVIRVGGDYYMVASSFTYLPGVPLLHSRDLVHWEIINYCVKKLHFEKYRVPSHGSGTWAPSIRYHKGTFFVFVPLVDEGILVARSSDPYGEFEQNLLCESKGWIDPCPLWDDDGKAYMVFAYSGSRSGIRHRLSVAEIDPDCRRLLGEPRTIFDGEQAAPTAEGPKFYKKDGDYLILMPAGGVAEGWQACLKGKQVYGPYEYRVVMHQGNTGVNGPHQGGWVTTPDGRDWFIHFQDVIELGRITHLQPMCFVNGWPFIGQDQNGDGIGEPVARWRMPAEGKPAYQIAQSDDFSSGELGLQWQWQANPDSGNYSLAAHPGCLRLYCQRNDQRENLMWYAPNVLTQIPQKPELTMTAKLSLHGEEAGDFGGIGMVGQDYGYIGLYQGERGLEIRCYHGLVTEKEFLGKAQETCVYQHLLEDMTGRGGCGQRDKQADSIGVWLRLDLKGDKTYRFSWSLDGISYTAVNGDFPLVRATWTGAKLCLWSCARENQKSCGYCDYEFVEIADLDSQK